MTYEQQLALLLGTSAIAAYVLPWIKDHIVEVLDRRRAQQRWDRMIEVMDSWHEDKKAA